MGLGLVRSGVGYLYDIICDIIYEIIYYIINILYDTIYCICNTIYLSYNTIYNYIYICNKYNVGTCDMVSWLLELSFMGIR